MPRIFASYRREDAEGEAGRLFDDLVNHFGEDSVFLDVAAIEVGRDFRKAIDESVSTCTVLLAIIGKDWVDARTESGQRRLDDPADFVRLETASALRRDIPVVPVLVHGAKMPRPEQLPNDLKELAYRNGVELTHVRWRSDLELLIKALRPYVGPKRTEEPVGKAAEGAKPISPPPIPRRDVDESHGTDKTRASRRKFRALITTIILVLAIALSAGAYWFSPKQQSTVPDLTGRTLADVTITLEAADLAVGAQTYQEDAGKTPGTVLSQSPSPRTRVKSGTPVDVVLAKGQGAVEVPLLTGESLDEAQKALRDGKLAIGTLSREPKPDVPQDTVLDQFPKAGKKVDPGTEIDLVLSQASNNAGPGPSVTEQPKQSSVQPSLPNFAGTWQLFETNFNGVTTSVTSGRPMTITQDGSIVHMAGRDLSITPTGTVTYQSLAANDGKLTRKVATEDQADVVFTYTWSVREPILTSQILIDYRRQFLNHPPGKDVRIIRYRRIVS